MDSNRSGVIIFCFAGRRANLELQLPHIRRILAENPDVEYHLWNLAHTDEDNRYLRTVCGERITVINDFYGDDPWQRFSDVYRHYADEQYRSWLFVKIDDDVVFVQGARFGAFIAAVIANRESVVSAMVINNAACTAAEPALMSAFEALRLPLLEAHKSLAFAEMSHAYFVENWLEMLGQPVELVPTED